MTDFERTRAMFDLPKGIVYLDGNSLGPLPRAATDAVARVMRDEWGHELIRAWNTCGWMAQPLALGDRIGRLIGAPPGTVAVGDTLSIKVYQALASALRLRPGRRVILSDSGNFPSDLYMAQGLIGLLGDRELRTPAPEDVAAAINEDVAVVMLTEVDYRTGRRHDMPALTARAHAAGALIIWDLAHSAGAVPVDVAGGNADFAVGCTYKYLNGGPGSPAFIYLGPSVADQARPALAGWLGHDAPFAFDPDYRPAGGVARMRVGTPPILAYAALSAALDVWDEVDMADLRARSIELSERFIAEVEARCPDLELASPRDPHARGSQVSFRFADGYAAMQALIARGVIGDFRAPDIMRFGFTPLYLTEAEVVRGAEVLEEVIRDRLYDRPEHRRVEAVT
ncbi:kynureninase [Amaricoccus macauensis]|uniref:Kynureninase n=1 Tax=Amaricoccus macauensis TaxID=57001 RepID=A0A840SJ35_9RHOB|nr:kynureninase [Amaricoccus macauensis]MBB5220770.1 kynureninase [Amaricoccus macauensis]